MKYRLPKSLYRAIVNAKTSVAHDAPLEASEAAKLLAAIDVLQGMVRARSTHIGVMNTVIAEMIDDDTLALLPPYRIDQLTDLQLAGISLAIENSGLQDGHW